MTEEKIREFYEKYYEKETMMSMAENSLFEKTESPQEWIDRLKKRSQISRTLFQENKQMIDEVLGELTRHPENVTPEIFDVIRQEAREALVENKQDLKVDAPLAESLLTYMKENHFLTERIYQVRQLQSDTVSLNMVENQYQKEFEYIWDAVSNLADYDTYDLERKEQAIRSNYNSMVLECVYSGYSYKDIVDKGEMLLQFLDRPNVIQDCKHFVRVKRKHYQYLIKMNMVEVYCNKHELDPETLNKILRYVVDLQSEDPEHKDSNLTCYALYWQYAVGNLTANQYFEVIYEYFCNTDGRPKYFEEISGLNELKDVPNSFYIGADVVMALGLTDYPYEKKCQLYQDIISRFFTSLNSIKRGRFDATMADFIQKFVLCLEGYCGTKQDLITIILNIYIKQQIQTFLHTVMVQKIALVITDSILEHAPELFVGFEELRTPEMVMQNKSRVREYVNFACMLHDVGKVSISEIVNMQTRSLTNAEFERMKKHPELGAFLLERFPVLREYIDVVLGHHKFYDGTKGYPEDFDNVSCIHKPVVDLITVCDSMDAATDILGRNYTTGKSFEELLTELKEQSGTRYSPGIVSYIQNSKELQERLKNLVTVQREQVYYEIYSTYFS